LSKFALAQLYAFHITCVDFDDLSFPLVISTIEIFSISKRSFCFSSNLKLDGKSLSSHSSKLSLRLGDCYEKFIPIVYGFSCLETKERCAVMSIREVNVLHKHYSSMSPFAQFFFFFFFLGAGKDQSHEIQFQ
jgi:hypothetical protein